MTIIMIVTMVMSMMIIAMVMSMVFSHPMHSLMHACLQMQQILIDAYITHTYMVSDMQTDKQRNCYTD